MSVQFKIGALFIMNCDARWTDSNGISQIHRYRIVGRITVVDRGIEWELARVLEETGRPPFIWARSAPTAGGMIRSYADTRCLPATIEEAADVSTIVGDGADYKRMREFAALRVDARRKIVRTPAQRVKLLADRQRREARRV
jgi:hypothetical protein